MKILLVIIGLILLSACASTPPSQYYWTKDGQDSTYGKEGGYGRDELERDFAGCNAQLALIPFARTSDPGEGMMGFGTALTDISVDMAKRNNYMINCMRAKGWRINEGVRPQ
jgi:hypothetical protein